MSLVQKIKQVYPELTDNDFVSNIIVENLLDVRGDYIAKWEHPTLAQPTQEQLDGISA